MVLTEKGDVQENGELQYSYCERTVGYRSTWEALTQPYEDWIIAFSISLSEYPTFVFNLSSFSTSASSLHFLTIIFPLQHHYSPSHLDLHLVDDSFTFITFVHLVTQIANQWHTLANHTWNNSLRKVHVMVSYYFLLHPLIFSSSKMLLATH